MGARKLTQHPELFRVLVTEFPDKIDVETCWWMLSVIQVLKTFDLPSRRRLQFWLTGGESQDFKLCVGVSSKSRQGHSWVAGHVGF